MMTGEPFTILQPSIHTTEWDQQLGEAVPGWLVKALWLATNTLIPVFVPDSVFSAGNVKALILAKGAVQDQVAALGRGK